MNKIDWQLSSSFAFAKEHSLLYRGTYLGKGVQMEIHTPKRKNGTFGKQKTFFFIDGDKRQFETEQNLMEAVNNLNQREEPENG